MGERFEKLAARHKDAVYRQMLRMCGNHEDAEDVLVQSLMKAYRAIDQLHDDMAFQGWLAQIARRTCGRLKHRESLRPVIELANLEAMGVEPVDPDADTAGGAFSGEMKSCLQLAFDKLPQHYQDVYRLRDLEERSAEETASLLGITVPNVKSRLHRARAMLRELIDCAIDDI